MKSLCLLMVMVFCCEAKQTIRQAMRRRNTFPKTTSTLDLNERLAKAVNETDLETVKELFSNKEKVDVNYVSTMGGNRQSKNAILHLAVLRMHHLNHLQQTEQKKRMKSFQFQIIQQLLAQPSIQINLQNEMGETPLSIATKFGVGVGIHDHSHDHTHPHQSTVDEHGYDESGNVNVVTLLLNKGSAIDVSDKKGFFPIHQAMQLKNLGRRLELILELILAKMHFYDEHDSETGEQGKNKKHADEDHDASGVHIKMFGQINMTTKNEKIKTTPLLMAANDCDEELSMIFLNAGANKNFMDENGDTALHLAARSCSSFDLIEKLIKANIDTSILNKKGQTAKDIAFLNRSLKKFSKNLKVFDTKSTTQRPFFGNSQHLLSQLHHDMHEEPLDSSHKSEKKNSKLHLEEDHHKNGHEVNHEKHLHEDMHDKNGHKSHHDKDLHEALHDKNGHEDHHDNHLHEDLHDKNGNEDHGKHLHEDLHGKNGHDDHHDNHLHEDLHDKNSHEDHSKHLHEDLHGKNGHDDHHDNHLHEDLHDKNSHEDHGKHLHEDLHGKNGHDDHHDNHLHEDLHDKNSHEDHSKHLHEDSHGKNGHDDHHDKHLHEDVHDQIGHADNHDKHLHEDLHDKHGHTNHHSKDLHEDLHDKKNHDDHSGKHLHEDLHDKNGHDDHHDNHLHQDLHDKNAHEDHEKHEKLHEDLHGKNGNEDHHDKHLHEDVHDKNDHDDHHNKDLHEVLHDKSGPADHHNDLETDALHHYDRYKDFGDGKVYSGNHDDDEAHDEL